MAEKSKVNSQQIAVCKTNKVLIEALDHLCLPDTEKHEPYAALHGKYSRICLTMCNYENKDNTSTMSFNIEPYVAGYLLMMLPAALGMQNFTYTADKMLQHKKNEDGTVLVTKLNITRSNTDKSGELRRNPWFIKIENGKGTPKDGKNGTSYFAGYQMERSAVIALADADFYMLMSKVAGYIRVWEDTNCPKMIREESERVRLEWQERNQAV